MSSVSLSLDTTPRKNTFWPILILAIGVAVFFSFYNYQITERPQENLLKMEKGGGKNAPHANQKARKAAEEAYDKAKKAYDELFKKPDKTPEEKATLDKLKKQVEHWRKKKDWKGENHSQKNKGGN